MLHFGLADCQSLSSHALFWAAAAARQKLGTMPTNFDILESVCGHGNISIDAGPFHVIHVCRMSDVVM
jgi:hypothetical protein